MSPKLRKPGKSLLMQLPKSQLKPLLPRRYGEFQLSPSQQSLVLTINENRRSDIWLYEGDRKTLTRLTDSGLNYAPIWHPSGRKILFAHLDAPHAVPRLVEMAPDGSRKRTIDTIPDLLGATAFLPDGKTVLVNTFGEASVLGLNIETGKRMELERSHWFRAFPTSSPNGRWLAYVSDESGRWEIYLRPLNGTGERHRVSRDGGEEPVWDRTGRRLYYRFGDCWFKVDITVENQLHLGRPTEIMRGPYVNIPGYSYALAAGEKFLVLTSEYQDRRSPRVKVIEQWPALLVHSTK